METSIERARKYKRQFKGSTEEGRRDNAEVKEEKKRNNEGRKNTNTEKKREKFVLRKA